MLNFASASQNNLRAIQPREINLDCIGIVKDYGKAISAQTVKKCPLASHVVDWLRLREGTFNGPFHEGVALMKAHAWPDQEGLRDKIEGLLGASTPDAEILEWFGKHPVQTGAGAYYHLRALSRKGGDHKVGQLAKKYWVDLNFQKEDEEDFLRMVGHHLEALDHGKRTERLLWDARVDAALRMIHKLPKDKIALVHARVNLIRDLPGVETHLARVPAPLKNDEGLWHSRTRWRLMHQLDNAGEYLVKNPAFKSDHGAYWIKERIAVAREFLRQSQFKKAYQILAPHGMKEGADYADAEWLAGWIALRFLGQPQKARQHFTNLYHHTKTPVSKGRAAYWAARAEKELKQPQAYQKWLKKAAQYPAHFYGQLAYMALHKNKLPQLETTATPLWKHFASSPSGLVLQLLLKAGHEDALKSYLEHLAQSLSPKDRRSLMGFLKDQAPRFVVFAARKIARFESLMIPEAYPVEKSVLAHRDDGIDPALVLAVIRQESDFDPKATSSAGAMGLMQLMNATAKEMAVKLKLKFVKADLHNRPDFNIKLGRHYLERLLKSFDASHALALAAYNAGPGNVRRWINTLGDPREASVDTIDWIEQIPFEQTRGYVHRVMENYVIYRQVLQSTSVSKPAVKGAGKRDLKPAVKGRGKHTKTKLGGKKSTQLIIKRAISVPSSPAKLANKRGVS